MVKSTTTLTAAATTQTPHFKTTGKRSITTSDHDSLKISSVKIATLDEHVFRGDYFGWFNSSYTLYCLFV